MILSCYTSNHRGCWIKNHLEFTKSHQWKTGKMWTTEVGLFSITWENTQFIVKLIKTNDCSFNWIQHSTADFTPWCSSLPLLQSCFQGNRRHATAFPLLPSSHSRCYTSTHNIYHHLDPVSERQKPIYETSDNPRLISKSRTIWQHKIINSLDKHRGSQLPMKK